MEIATIPILYLASASFSRQKILQEVGIPFLAVEHGIDESVCDTLPTLEERVEELARLKVSHAQLPPPASEETMCYVLAADTLTQSPDGTIYGKPQDREQAKELLRAKAQGASQTTTSFCLDKKLAVNDRWETIARVQRTVSGETWCDVPEKWIDRYLDMSGALGASGSLAVEGLGQMFVQTVCGSYSAIRGLPVFELRQALEQLGFFSSL